MGTYMLSTWIKSITGQNNLAYFQSELNPEIDLSGVKKVVHVGTLEYRLLLKY